MVNSNTDAGKVFFSSAFNVTDKARLGLICNGDQRQAW